MSNTFSTVDNLYEYGVKYFKVTCTKEYYLEMLPRGYMVTVQVIRRAGGRGGWQVAANTR